MTAQTASPAAIMASADYQAWAETDQAAPEPKPTFAQELADVLTAAQAGALQSIVSAGIDIYKLAVRFDETCHELYGTHFELHAAWKIAYERETGRKADAR